MKKFFSFTKFLWIGGIMGMAQQLLGHFNYLMFKGNGVVDITEIMHGLALYAMIILLVINRDASPKQQCIDLILFFVGLDLFYYLYIFIVELIPFLTDKFGFTDYAYEYQEGYFQKTSSEIYDFIKWTSIGVAAAVWAFVATKFRNMKKKVLYILMLIPLFGVIVLQVIVGFIGSLCYLLQEIGALVSEDSSLVLPIFSFITAIVCLVVGLRAFCKKPAEKSIEQG